MVEIRKTDLFAK
jgi:putative addiction module killer protein/probable addiction module antidote protein